MSRNWNDDYVLKVVNENEIEFVKEFYNNLGFEYKNVDHKYKLWYMPNRNITRDTLGILWEFYKHIYSISGKTTFDDFVNQTYEIYKMSICIWSCHSVGTIYDGISDDINRNNTIYTIIKSKLQETYILLYQIFNFKDIQIYTFKIYCNIFL